MNISTIHATPRAPPFIPSEGDKSVLMHHDPSADWLSSQRSSRPGRSERNTTVAHRFHSQRNGADRRDNQGLYSVPWPGWVALILVPIRNMYILNIVLSPLILLSLSLSFSFCLSLSLALRFRLMRCIRQLRQPHISSIPLVDPSMSILL